MLETTPLILLVDDDADFLEINRHILEPAGYRVVCQTDPKQAWEHIVREKPDLIISDLMMSSLDSGFSLARRVRQDPRFEHIPIIIATAVSSQMGADFRPRTPQDLITMNVDAYFDKPVPPRKLLDAVRELLSR